MASIDFIFAVQYMIYFFMYTHTHTHIYIYICYFIYIYIYTYTPVYKNIAISEYISYIYINTEERLKQRGQTLRDHYSQFLFLTKNTEDTGTGKA